MAEGFTAIEISRLAGFSTSTMLNYLERSKIFQSENERDVHHGKHRCYTYRDLVVLRAIHQLLALGARPKRIAAAIATFRKIAQLPQSADALLEFSKKSSTFLVTKDRVLFCETPNDIINLTEGGQLELAFMLNVPRALNSVANAAKNYEQSVQKGQPKNTSTMTRALKKAENNG